MYFEGTHHTTYTYSDEVFLEPHTIRFRPRSDPRQTTLDFSATTSPEPDGMTEGIDVYGNDIVWAWFSGTHDALEITTSFAVETMRDNPYDFIVPALEASELPPVYPEPDRSALFPYMNPSREEPRESHRRSQKRYPVSSSSSFRSSPCGSIRRVRPLFVEACRSVGVAARFVSGYVADKPSGRRELHARGAAYVAGAGWRGYDPTLDLRRFRDS